MTTPIKIKRSGTASSTPSSLDHGELAINYADDTLFWKDSSNTIQSFVFQAYASATHASSHSTGGSDALTPADIGAAPAASPAITGNATFEASSGVPVTITNTGSGNSFVVNDIGGDTSPFLVDASGNTGIGANPGSFSTSFNQLVVGDGGAFKGATIYSTTQGTLAFGDTAVTTAAGFQGFVAYIHTTDYMSFGTAGAERVRITSAGDVGIGRGIPASRLDVNGVITVNATSGSAGSYLPSLTISGDSNTGFGQVSGQSDSASVFTAGHERVRVTSAGAVGIGTSSIDAGVTLDTRGTIQAKAAGVKIQAVDSSVIVKTQASNSTSEGIVGTESNHNLAIRANNVAALRVKTTGALRFVPLSADPASGEAGDVYYNSSTNKLRVYNGTSWVDLH